MRPGLQFLFLALSACGGATVILPDSDGGGKDGSGGGDGSGSCTGTFTCFCGTPYCDNGTWKCPSNCGDPCATLLAQIDAARKTLRSCCPTCKSLQCQGKARDVCCEITVNGGDVAGFEALVTKYKNMCQPMCPGVPCPPVPSMICDPDTSSDPNAGHCR